MMKVFELIRKKKQFELKRTIVDKLDQKNINMHLYKLE